MRLQTITHVPFETPAHILQWAGARGLDVSHTPLHQAVELPEPEAADGLVVMGGPMGVHDHAAYPWLASERDFLRAFMETGKPVLGICLGAQLIAAAMGAEVRANKEKEIGWFPVEKTGKGRDCPLLDGLPDTFIPLHWHGDTFAIPQGAVHLAESRACANQAFLAGERIVGLQFHLEANPESVAALTANCAGELAQGGAYIQAAPDIHVGVVTHTPVLHAGLELLLDRLFLS